MSETDNKPTLGRKPLGLKRSVEAGEVKQTFSHGRTNKVVVEVKRRKILKPASGDAAETPVKDEPQPEEQKAAPAPKKAPAKKAPAAPKETPQERVARLQREAEEARLTALEDVNRREQEERLRAIEEEKKRAEDNRKAEEEAVAAVEAKAREEAEAAAAVAAEAETETETPADESTPVPAPRKFTPVEKAEPKKAEPAQKRTEAAPKKPERTRGGDRRDRRQSGQLTVARALNDDEGARARSLAALQRAREKERRAPSVRSVRSRFAMSSSRRRSPFRSWRTAWPRRVRTSSRRCSTWA